MTLMWSERSSAMNHSRSTSPSSEVSTMKTRLRAVSERSTILRFWRRHWIAVPPVVGVFTFLIQLAIYGLSESAGVAARSALDQALFNLCVAVILSICLRILLPQGHASSTSIEKDLDRREGG